MTAHAPFRPGHLTGASTLREARAGVAVAGRWQDRLGAFVQLERRLHTARQCLRTDLLLTFGAISFLVQHAHYEPSMAPMVAISAAFLAALGLLALPVLVAIRRALLTARNLFSHRFYRAGMLLDHRDAQWTLTDRGTYEVIASYPPAPHNPGAG